MKILDLGCGTRKHPEAIGLDMNPGVHPDVLHEVRDRNLLPFEDNLFDKVYMIDFLEHVDDPEWILSEVHRVSKSDAEVNLQYPHYNCPDNYSDITHRHRLGIHCLEHYDPTTEFGKMFRYYKKFGRNFQYKIEKIDTTFPDSFPGRMSRFLMARMGPNIYERHISCFLPIKNIQARLRVLKEKN